MITTGIRPRSTMRSTTVLAVTLVLMAGGWSGLQAQAGRFEEVTEVVLVEVPVQVLKDGEPVRGLTAESFEIVDGRQKREIVSFEVVDLSLAAEAQPPVSTAARRHFLFLFDLSFSDPGAVVRARQAAVELVGARMHPSDLAAVATYSRNAGVNLLLGFTSDKRQISLAIDTLGLPQLVESRRDPLGLTFTDLRDTRVPGAGGEDTDVRGIDPEAEITELLQTLEGDIRRTTSRNDILSLTSSMAGLAEMMKSVDGRKYVVYLSEGFDSSILLGTRGTTAEEQAQIQQQNQAAMEGRVWEVDSDQRFGNTASQNQLSLMLDEFVRADCTIQAVDIGGLRAGADVRPRASSEDGLFIMANDTGGELYRNFNNLAVAMDAMLQRTSVTYVLAFQPADLAYDGQFHKLKIRLKDGPKGTRLVHRPGYFAPRPYGGLSAVERQLSTASMIFGSPGGEIGTSVLATPFNAGQPLAYVPVLIEIDGPSLLAGQEGNVLPAEIYAYAVAADGTVRDFFTQAMGMDLSKVGEALEQSGFKFWGQFDLEPGSYTARVVVRNSQTGAAGVEVSSFRVPDFDQSEAGLLPPLFPEPQGKWLLGREQQAQQTSYPYPYLLRQAPFIPAARPVVRSGQAAEISLAGYNLGEGPLEVRGALYSAAGERVGEVEMVLTDRSAADDPSLERFVATCRIGKPPAGSYRLEIVLRDSTTGREHSSSIPVLVSG